MVKGLQSPGVGAFFLVFVLLVRTAAANPIVKIAPYEPVIIEVPMAKGTTKALQSHQARR